MSILFFIIFFDYSLGMDADFVYDDNIFNYSQKYLDEFLKQIRPYRFPFDTYDDFVTNVGFNLLLRNRFIKNLTTTFNLKVSLYSYLINCEKDYQSFLTGLRQSLGKFALRFEYLLMPRYLIRYYKAPEGEDYIGCKFSENLLSLKFSYLPNDRMNFSMAFKKEKDNYIESFDCYDSKASRVELIGELVLTKFYESSVEYEFKDSRANGPVPDISYQQHLFRLNNLFRTKFPKFSKIEWEYELKYRIYTTEVPPELDSPHSGRLDTTNLIKLGLEAPLFTALIVTFSYSYEFRNSFSDVYKDIAEYKNYRKVVGSAGFKFYY